MNKEILNKEVQEFINSNLKTDITKLILKGSPFKNISIQELAEQIEAKKRCKKKLPTWFSTENIYYPNKLNIEQTSSEIAAQFKSEIVSGKTLVDLTGGLGIDSYYFSNSVENVVHCELNENLSNIVTHNYNQLNKSNIKTFNGDGFDYLKSINNVDCIYIDPSRRNDIKGKVFLLEDCLPNVPKNIDFLFSKAEKILVKVSPILDITSAINELKYVKKVFVVAIKNEVKELLFLLKKEFNEVIKVETFNFNNNDLQKFNFNYKEESNSTFNKPLKFLFEPNTSILKAGGFQQISKKFQIHKLHQHSHLFTSNNLIDFPGRTFKIVEVLPYNKKVIKKSLESNKANITTRNFNETVEEIRKKLGLKNGGDTYLFFTKNMFSKPILIVCKKTKSTINGKLN